MFSALIVHARPEPALALTLSRLVEAALAGLLADVAVLDLAGDPLARRLCDGGGCALIRPPGEARSALAEAARRAKADWLLVAASGLAPAPGWAAQARETLALAQAHGPGFSGALFAVRPRGLLARLSPPDGVALARRDLFARAAISPLHPGRDAFAAARRAGGVRRLDGLCDDERG